MSKSFEFKSDRGFTLYVVNARSIKHAKAVAVDQGYEDYKFLGCAVSNVGQSATETVLEAYALDY